MKTLVNILGKFTVVFSIIFIIWLCLSWIEVSSKNTMENPVYNQYNAFVVMAEF